MKFPDTSEELGMGFEESDEYVFQRYATRQAVMDLGNVIETINKHNPKQQLKVKEHTVWHLVLVLTRYNIPDPP